MGKFGWDLPPGVSLSDLDPPMGPLDCPVCVDGVELDGPDCPVDPTHGPTCPTHGCPTCNDLEKQRVYCHGPFCGDYIRKGQTPVVDAATGNQYCSDRCLRDDQDMQEYAE